jgi:hypothetical protein
MNNILSSVLSILLIISFVIINIGLVATYSNIFGDYISLIVMALVLIDLFLLYIAFFIFNKHIDTQP